MTKYLIEKIRTENISFEETQQVIRNKNKIKKVMEAENLYIYKDKKYFLVLPVDDLIENINESSGGNFELYKII